jgi:Ca2+:H+ antiporter
MPFHGSSYANVFLVLQQGDVCVIDFMFSMGSLIVNSKFYLVQSTWFVMGLMFPAVLHFTHSEVTQGTSEVALSRFSSCIMFVAHAS